ncbi:hypothetical protein [Amycolatopsis sp. NPDC059657]|uniref:hypothetical protein n=1 Tax=Amycolatopsis sp. NPDC059657 TaxID=3346899 RepID=UPI003671381B
MEETDLRAALRAYVTTDEPPIGLAESTVVKAGQRAKRRHAVAAIGSAVVLVVAMVAGGAVVLPKLHSTVPVASKAPCAANRLEETDEEGRARLTCVMRFVLRPFLPAGVKLGRDGEGQTPPPGDDPLELAIEDSGFGAAYKLRLNITDDQGLGALVMSISRGQPDPWAQAEYDKCGPPQIDCSRVPGPRGGRLSFETLKSPDGIIYHYSGYVAPDVSVSLISGNAMETNFAHTPTKPSRPLPYFDYRQMEAIMTAPDLVY